MSRDEDIERQALDAAVRQHFESLHAAGLCAPFSRIGERSRRIVRAQLRGTVLAVLASAFASPDTDRCQACTGGPDSGRGHTMRGDCAGSATPDADR